MPRPSITAILASALLAACAVLGLAAPAALADGDPASDVLVDRQYFQPVDLTLPPASQQQLSDLLAATVKAGAPVRVALIASAADLGTATALWGKPQSYAEYLGYELSLDYSGRLLVVMPQGLGVYWSANSAGARVLADKLAAVKPASSSGTALLDAAQAGVYAVEAAAGISQSALSAPAATGSGTAGAATGSSSAAKQAGEGFGNSGAEVLALVVGLVLIGAAWGASVRARPLSLRRRLGA